MAKRKMRGKKKMNRGFLKGLASTLAVIGAFNWGLVSFFDFNLVTTIFGAGTAPTSVILGAVGLSGLYLAVLWVSMWLD